MQHVAYPSQLEMKKQRIIDALKKTPLSLHVHDVQGMQDPYHYRNKMIIGFSRNNAGDIISGLYEESSHRIVSASTCLLHPKECDEVIATIVDLMKRLRIEPYDARRQRGFLRHAVIRYGVHTRQILVTLRRTLCRSQSVCTAADIPSSCRQKRRPEHQPPRYQCRAWKAGTYLIWKRKH